MANTTIGRYETMLLSTAESVIIWITARVSAAHVSVDWQVGEFGVASGTGPVLKPVTNILRLPIDVLPDDAPWMLTFRDGPMVTVTTTNVNENTHRLRMCRWKSPFCRTIEVEVDAENAPLVQSFVRSESYANVQALVTQGFANAGVECLFPSANAMGTFDTPVTWSESTLNQVMAQVFEGRGRGVTITKNAVFSVLLCDTHIQPDVLGIMFDLEQPQREGCAVFLRTFTFHPHVRRDVRVAKSLLHELGHAMNLLHPWDQDPKRSGSLTFMTYPQRWAPASRSTEEQFWARLLHVWKFDEVEELHLQHAAPRHILPGGSHFGAGSCVPPTAVAAAPRMSRRPSNGAKKAPVP